MHKYTILLFSILTIIIIFLCIAHIIISVVWSEQLKKNPEKKIDKDWLESFLDETKECNRLNATINKYYYYCNNPILAKDLKVCIFFDVDPVCLPFQIQINFDQCFENIKFTLVDMKPYEDGNFLSYSIAMYISIGMMFIISAILIIMKRSCSLKFKWEKN